MTPELEQLSARLLAATEQFAAQVRPGVPIDPDSPEARQIRSMLEEMDKGLRQYQDEETARFQAALKEAQTTQPSPPPPPDYTDLLKQPLAITYQFQERHAPDPEMMNRVVQALLKLGKE